MPNLTARFSQPANSEAQGETGSSCKQTRAPSGAEGFALGPLLKIQESLARFAAVYDEVTASDEHRAMLSELMEIDRRMMELELDNRLANGTPNPAFELWTAKDQSAVDVPLWSPDRVWEWKEEGVSWVEIEEE